MNQLKNAFKNIPEIELPTNLESKILLGIKTAKVRQMKIKLIFSYIGLVGSIILGIYTTITFGESFLRSEFWSMIALAFSDSGAVAKYWNDFLYSLMETFPALVVAILLTPVFTLLLSINSYLNLNHRSRHKFI